MEIPLQVAKDEEGIFRDALNRPMIMVFNSTKKHAKNSKKAGSKSDDNANHTESPLMFVQVNRSKKEARLERTKIRTHVMQNHFRQKQEKKAKPLQKRPHHIEHSQESVQASVVTSNSHIEICAFRLQPTASLDPFASYPIEMDPRTHLLAHQCKRLDSLLVLYLLILQCADVTILVVSNGKLNMFSQHASLLN